MKRVLLLLLLSLVSAWGAPTAAEQWIRASVTTENGFVCGFENSDEIKSFTLGAAITPHEIDSELLQSYPSTAFSKPSSMRYVPVLVNREARCFLLTDSIGTPYALGYRDLAKELNKIAALYSVGSEEITLYESRQINAFLFSVTPRSSSTVAPVPQSAQKNLTVLRQGWENPAAVAPAPLLSPSPSAPPLLTSESETIEQLLRTVGQP